MANDFANPYGGGPFRRLAAFEMSADRALKKLRERRQAELDVQQSSAEKALFGNFVAGGRTADGGFQPFREENLPNVAGLATSKRYAPVIDALMGVEGIRQRDRLGKDQEFQDLINRYRAETDRKNADTKAVEAENERVKSKEPKPVDPATRRAIADSKRNLATHQSVIKGFESNPKLMADYGRIIQDTEFQSAVSAGNVDMATAIIARLTGDTTPQKVIAKRYLDYIKALNEEPGEMAYLKDLGVDTTPLIRKPVAKQPPPLAKPSAYRETQGGKSILSKSESTLLTAPVHQDSLSASQLLTAPVHQDSLSASQLLTAPVHQDSLSASQLLTAPVHQDTGGRGSPTAAVTKTNSPNFDDLSPYIAKHESGGGKLKFNLNRNGSVDVGLYQINTDNLDRARSGNKLANVLDPIFEKSGIGKMMNKRVDALYADDRLNEEVARAIFDQRGLDQWASKDKVMESFNAAQSSGIRIRIAKSRFGLDAGTIAVIPEDKFDASYMEKVK